jgi:hypothetical protein
MATSQEEREHRAATTAYRQGGSPSEGIEAYRRGVSIKELREQKAAEEQARARKRAEREAHEAAEEHAMKELKA